MAVGSGLSSSFGIATETTVGNPAAVTNAVTRRANSSPGFSTPGSNSA